MRVHFKTPATTGMTLLEVLIGVAILSIIIVCLGQLSWLMTKGRQRMDRRAQTVHAAQVVVERIANDVSMAFLVTAPALRGLAGGAPVIETAFRGNDRGDEDELDFTTLAGRRLMANSPQSDMRKVGYRVATVPDTPDVKQLVRRESAKLEGDVRDGGDPVPMVEGIKAFQLEYYDSATGDWGPDWDSTEQVHQGKLPAAVRITVKLADPNRPGQIIMYSSVALVGLAAGPIDF